METLLNLEELVYETTKPAMVKMNYFNEILLKCHKTIKHHNLKYKTRSCKYKIPIFTFGKPLYNIDELALFLYKNLTENGLFVKYLNKTNELYISWELDKINYDLYIKNKTKKLKEPLQRAIEKPSSFSGPTDKKTVKFKNNSENVILFEGVPVNKEKYDQAMKINSARKQYYSNLIKENKTAEGFNDFCNSVHED